MITDEAALELLAPQVMSGSDVAAWTAGFKAGREEALKSYRQAVQGHWLTEWGSTTECECGWGYYDGEGWLSEWAMHIERAALDPDPEYFREQER